MPDPQATGVQARDAGTQRLAQHWFPYGQTILPHKAGHVSRNVSGISVTTFDTHASAQHSCKPLHVKVLPDDEVHVLAVHFTAIGTQRCSQHW